jgi:hypothetical protein
MKSHLLLTTIAAVVLVGCATTQETLYINSDPTGASVKLSSGQIGVTPCDFKVPLNKPLVVILEKEGYRTVKVPVNRGVSEKAVTGKIVGVTAGAAISFATMGYAGTELMSAPFSRSSKKLKPNPVNVKLSPPNTVIIKTGVK